MLELYSIASGSSGNCSVVTDGKSAVLIDCGISGKNALAGLAELDIAPETIRAVIVTHEHNDHIKGVGVISRRLGIPVYATRGTLRGMGSCRLDESVTHIVTPDVEFEIDGIGITPVTIPHDANDPCCYTLTDGKEKASIATDIGVMTDALLSRLAGSSKIILEANHDVSMLRFGSYPYPLKRRILSDVGHLSNESAAHAALELVRTGTEHIMLGHLSAENNLPEIAQLEVFNFLTDNGVRPDVDMTLKVAHRRAVCRA